MSTARSRGRRGPLPLLLPGLVLLLASCGGSGGGLLLARGGRTAYRIVTPAAAIADELKAAGWLRDAVEAVSGAALPIVTDEEPARDEEIVVGRSLRLAEGPVAAVVRLDGLGADGFIIRTIGRRIVIAGGGGPGTLRGTAAFLEDALGCRKLSADVLLRPKRRRLAVPALDRREIPAFAYREILMPDALDADYAAWHGIHNSRDRSHDWGLYVHTFKTLVPPEKYFRTHPEFFTEQNGIRVPDAQLCLTDPDVFKIVVAELRERMKANPEAKYWSVSQNDAFSPCQCPSCRAMDAKYGGPSGTILAFVNRVAREFPDKIISTLAYQYSRRAPTGIRPEPNVNIMLCTIECNRSRPIATDPANASFVEDIRDWSKLTDNIYLWDYVVQFRNYLDPFPNLRVLQPNLRFFRDNGIRLMFEQGSSTTRSELHELRTYLLARLIRNPDADVAALTKDFLEGFYGPAAPFIGRYIARLHDALDASGGDLGIYGFPWDGFKTYLTPSLLAEYEDLFARAERAVAGDPEYRDRIAFARLPLDFAVLEIAKRDPAPGISVFRREGGRTEVDPAIARRLDAFVSTAESAPGRVRLDETGTTPAAFKAEMESFFAEGMRPHLGLGRPVRLASEPSPKYPVGGAAALVDGLRGTSDYHCNWVGFEGAEMEAVVDLGRETPVGSVAVRFLQDINAWIWLPQTLEVSLSDDGAAFAPAGVVFARTDAKKAGVVVEELRYPLVEPRASRYVKVRTKSFLACPPWHKGAGGLAWIFADEIVID
jgi:hypothetical protein